MLLSLLHDYDDDDDDDDPEEIPTEDLPIGKSSVGILGVCRYDDDDDDKEDLLKQEGCLGAWVCSVV